MANKTLAKTLFVLFISMFGYACTWTERVNVSSTGVEANASGQAPQISGDGRFVVYWSNASNLVPNDTNGRTDVFWRDTLNGTTARASLNSSGNQINTSDGSSGPSISANGSIVGFSTRASDVVPNDTNFARDVFLRDLSKNETTRISVDSNGNQGNAESSYAGGLSHDGRYAVFASDADNLVSGDTNLEQDIFVHDRITEITTRVNVDSAGNQSNAGLPNASGWTISSDGRYVAFSSLADNLVPGDTNNSADVFLHDRVTGVTIRVSVGHLGGQANGPSRDPQLSTDGKSIAFLSEATNLVFGDTNGVEDVFVRRIQTLFSTTLRVSVSSAGVQSNNSFASYPSISGDGRYIGFTTDADNLVPDDTNGVWDVFIRDTDKGTTRRISKSRNGVQANGNSLGGAISKDGRYVTFQSGATNLADDDLNGFYDVFIRAIPEVEVTAVVPSMLPIGTTTSVTLMGNDFFPGTSPTIGNGTVSNVVIVNENTITMDVAVSASVASGARDVVVTLGGTGAGPFSGSASKCASCVTYF